MASPRRHRTLIEVMRERPSSIRPLAPARVDRIRPDAVGSARGASGRGGGFDVSSMGNWFAAGRRLNLPMGYVFIAVALVIASWIGMYMIGYSRAESATEAERIARLTSTTDPLLTGGAPATIDQPWDSGRTGPMRTPTSRPTPRVSASGPTGTGLPIRSGSASATNDSVNRAVSGLPAAHFVTDLNYLVIANDHRREAERAAAYLIDNGIRVTLIPVNNGATWRIVGLRGFTGEQMRAGEHRQYRDTVESLGRTWERDHDGSNDFGGMFFRKEK